MTHTILASPFVQGALAGLLAAALVDFGAFRTWKSLDDFRTYNWGLAAWRWFQGAVTGLITAAGIGVTQ